MTMPCNFYLLIIKVRGQNITSDLDVRHVLICCLVNCFLIELRTSKGRSGILKLKSLEFIAEG